MIRVLLVGDRSVALAGLRGHLAEEDFSVVATARTGSEAFERITRPHPDVVLVDSSAEGGAFLLCYRLSELARRQRVVLHVLESTPRLQVAAWVAGASGLASADTSAARLANMIRAAAAGHRTLPRPQIAAVRAAARQLAPLELSIFGMRMHDVPAEEISRALRLDPLAVDARARSLVELLSCDGALPRKSARRACLTR